MIHNIKAAYAGAGEGDDRGDLVSTLIITAGFAIAAILFVNWISTAVTNKAADTAACIEGSNTYKASPDGETKVCESTNHGASNSFTKDRGYQSRYGSRGSVIM